MKLRPLIITVAALGAVLAGAAAAALWSAEHKMHRRIEVPVAALAVPTDAAAIERGRYLFASRGCADCHGKAGAGRKAIDSGGLRVIGPQIAPGARNVTASYRPEDWARTLRHGVKPSGEPLMVMPSEDYNRLTDADLGALVAYIRQLPEANGEVGLVQLPPLVRALYGLGVIQDAAAKIDHSRPVEAPVPEGPTIDHGRYVAQMCQGCHGPGYSGGKIPGGPPDWPAAANLTPGEGTVMTRYPDVATFTAMMRSGKRPDGSAVKVMPFESLGQMNDVDLQGLHAYLRSLPARAAGGR